MRVDHLKKTPLFAQHKEAKAKLVDFGGWALPVSYSSVLKEHEAVRSECGIFDVSHMGEVIISGPDSLKFANHLVTNNLENIQNGMAQYSGMLNEDGGFIDDLIVYRLNDDKILFCINAANIDKDLEWIKSQQAGFAVSVKDESAAYAQIALQGPLSSEVLLECFPEWSEHNLAKLAFMNFKVIGSDPAQPTIIARTGYTGESGFEIYLPNAQAAAVWTTLINHAKVTPCGLGARDTLRLESCYLLYGNDMDEGTSPLEAGIAWAVKLDKPGAFIGQKALVAQKAAGPDRKMIAFKLEEAGIPRKGMAVFLGDEQIGEVTSGSVLPTVGGAGGMALIKQSAATIGDNIHIDLRGKRKLARIEKRPLYSPRTR